MPRYKFTIEYDGSNYCGWQFQPNVPTIQAAVEHAIHKVTLKESRLHVSGRTDAGVHALAQVAHADIEKNLDPYKLTYSLNHFLKNKQISIIKTESVKESFHARFSTKSRSYVYKIVNRNAQLALLYKRAYHVARPLNVELMNEAAQHLIGTHDFTSFRATGCQAPSPIKTLEQAEFIFNDNVIEFHTRSRSFLHHQVRNMIGTLCLVGIGKWSAFDVKKALEKQDRRSGGPTAPPEGLYLKEIIY